MPMCDWSSDVCSSDLEKMLNITHYQRNANQSHSDTRVNAIHISHSGRLAVTWILYKMTREATLTEAGSGSAVPGLGVGAGISTRGTKEPPVAVGRLHSWTVAWLHSSLSLLRSSWCTLERANFTALYTQSWLSDLAHQRPPPTFIASRVMSQSDELAGSKALSACF